MQKEIAELEVLMPQIPLYSDEQLKAINDPAMQMRLERDLVVALQAYT